MCSCIKSNENSTERVLEEDYEERDTRGAVSQDNFDEGDWVEERGNGGEKKSVVFDEVGTMIEKEKKRADGAK